MAIKSTIILTAALAVASATVAAAKDEKIPEINLQKRCTAAANAAVELMGDKDAKSKAFDACMRSEQEARDAIVSAWKEIPSQYKTFCIKPNVYSPSYVEWIACLEMQMDVKRLRAKK
jgi:hypothetical protein